MRSLLLLLAALFIATAPAAAEEVERYTAVQAFTDTAELVPNTKNIITIATEVALAPEWHVYWLNPGDSGLPVKITWHAPEGIEFGDIQWPTPDKISYDILANYGYYDRVALLQEVTIPAPLSQTPITLTGDVEMLVCKEICIPEYGTVTLNLNTPDAANHGMFIAEAKTKLPTPLTGNFTYAEQDDQLVMHFDANIVTPHDNIEFFPLEWGILNYVESPTVTRDDGTLILHHKRSDRAVSEIDTLTGLLVIKGEAHGENIGYQVTLTPDTTTTQKAAAPIAMPNDATPPQPTPPTDSDVTWLSALYLALFGGLILNLMPCVFPVLSMKALSLVKMGEKERKTARAHGWAYTAGVILSFLLIGGVLVALTSAGAIVGWGFQLQNPIVVAVLAYILFTLGLNLMGFFDIGGRFGNVGHSLTTKQSLSGSFFTGALATVVATPCTAPFMGVAMGFAITQPAIVSLSVFAMLGFGLALPYLILSYSPQLRRFLPKPGAWMDTFKQFLAFPIFASALWLVWVFAQQASGLLYVLMAMLSIVFAIWGVRVITTGALRKIIVIVFALAIPLYTLSQVTPLQPSAVKTVAAEEFGKAFSPATLETALAGDHPVFVEMTAAWCITCKFNHAVGINIPKTKTTFSDYNVTYLIGDWTNYDDVITDYLAQFGRNGVPIYVYYGGRNAQTGERPAPQLLPQVLTPNTIASFVRDQENL